MKLVSSSKLKKAEELARRSKVYMKQLNAMFDDIISKVRLRGLDSINSRYFVDSKDKEIKKIDIIFITADKGLCGGFNTATIKEVMRLMQEYKQKGLRSVCVVLAKRVSHSLLLIILRFLIKL